jgi:very-short-patch-repair endonuclease
MSQRVDRARRLRRDQTDAERILWSRLRDRRLNGLKFKRQVPIDRYIADFCCADAGLIIELDGGHHSANEEADVKRSAVLESCGYLVLRYWNNDVTKNLDGVLEDIVATLSRAPSATLAPRAPHPGPLPFGEREKKD